MRRQGSRWKRRGHLDVGKTTRRREGDCMGPIEDQSEDQANGQGEEEVRKGEERPKTRMEETKLSGRREQEARRQATKESQHREQNEQAARDCRGCGRGACREGEKRKDKGRGRKRRPWRSRQAERRACGHQPEGRMKRVAGGGHNEARRDGQA